MRRVIIADDHPFILAAVEALLAGAGFEVVAALNDGQAVLDKLESTRCDLIILDVEMPTRTGVDVLAVLRGRGDARPVVLLTGSLTDERLVQALKLGVNGIVLKDSAQAILIRCVEEVTRGGRWIDKVLLGRVAETVAGDEDRKSPLLSLAPRERAIVSSVASGKKNREIAEELRMSEGTVKVYLNRIFQKLQIKSRTELALFARAADW